MSEMEVKKVENEWCHGCGNRKSTLSMIQLPYATGPIFLCDSCKEDMMKLIKSDRLPSEEK